MWLGFCETELSLSPNAHNQPPSPVQHQGHLRLFSGGKVLCRSDFHHDRDWVVHHHRLRAGLHLERQRNRPDHGDHQPELERGEQLAAWRGDLGDLPVQPLPLALRRGQLPDLVRDGQPAVVRLASHVGDDSDSGGRGELRPQAQGELHGRARVLAGSGQRHLLSFDRGRRDPACRDSLRESHERTGRPERDVLVQRERRPPALFLSVAIPQSHSSSPAQRGPTYHDDVLRRGRQSTAYCYVTDSQPTPATSSASATATFTGGGRVRLVSVNVSASTNNTIIGTTVDFTCTASGGGGGPFSYVWFDAVSGTGQNVSQSFMSPGIYVAGCAATDFATGAFGLGSTTVTVSSPPGSGPLSLFVLNPCRVLDTRNPPGPLAGPAIQPAGTADRAFGVTSFCGIPLDATAISVNVTVTNVSAPGVVSIYRGGGQPTGTNTIAFVAGRTRANNAILQLALDGAGTIRVQSSSPGTLDLVIDVNGFFR